MPNNLVFNDVASQLKTQIYGNNGGTATAISVDSNGNVTVTATDLDIRNLAAGTDTVSVAGTVTVTTDIVTVTATDLDIRNLAAGTDTVSVAGTVTVTTDIVTITATDLDIRNLSGATDSVIKGGNYFTESNVSINNVTGTGIALTMDNSQQDTYSFYVRNTGSAAVSVKLQISPTSTEAYFMDDPSGEVSVAADGTAVLVAQRFLKYTRLYYNAASAATFEVYYNAHA